MKDLIENAFEGSWGEDTHQGDYKGFALEWFNAGVEWMKSIFPMMNFPPCEMPEIAERSDLLIGEDTIVATTGDYIIFYKDKGHDVAYREYYRGNEDPKWRWKVRYGGYVDDDMIFCWMEK